MAYTPSYIWNIPPHGFLWRFPKMWVPPNLPFWIDMFHSKPSNLVYPHDYGNLQVHMLYLYMVYICSYIYIYLWFIYLYIYMVHTEKMVYIWTLNHLLSHPMARPSLRTWRTPTDNSPSYYTVHSGIDDLEDAEWQAHVEENFMKFKYDSMEFQWDVYNGFLTGIYGIFMGG